jgi:hypothetical protein
MSGRRTLVLRLANAQGALVRVSVKHGRRFVAKSAFRTVARATLRLTLDRRLARGRYLVKVIAFRGSAETVLQVKLKV